MDTVEFCHLVEQYAWEEYAFKGAGAICEKWIAEGKINAEWMTVAYATWHIVK